MKTFTIDADNNISAFATPEEAAATNPSQSFASQKELEELAAAWPAERQVAIWNSLPGIKPVNGFKSSAAVASRIWERIQGLGAPEPQPEQPAKPKAERNPKGNAKVAKGELQSGINLPDTPDNLPYIAMCMWAVSQLRADAKDCLPDIQKWKIHKDETLKSYANDAEKRILGQLK